MHATFLKITLGLPESARNQYSYVIAGVTHTSVETIRLPVNGVNTEAILSCLKDWRAEVEAATLELGKDQILAKMSFWLGCLKDTYQQDT